MKQGNILDWTNVLVQDFKFSNLYSWAASTLPPQYGLGLLLKATANGEFKWDVYSTPLSMGHDIIYCNRTLIAIPGEVRPFLITPVNWYFTFILWIQFMHCCLARNYLHLGPPGVEDVEQDLPQFNRGIKRKVGYEGLKGGFPGRASFFFMRLIAWNCRGFGYTTTIQRLKQLIRQYKPDFLFLSETKRSISFVSRVVRNLGYSCHVGTNPVGRSGGTFLAWQEDQQCSVLDSSPNWIHLSTKDISEKIGVNYFKEIFLEKNLQSEDMIFGKLQKYDIPSLQQNHLDILNKPFTFDECHVALNQMKPDGAPGPDGKIESLMSKFFWGNNGDHSKIHLQKWRDLCKRKEQGCKRKEQGGVALCDVYAFNQALLARHIWRIIDQKNMLIDSTLSAKYMEMSNWGNFLPRFNSSWRWKAIMKTNHVIIPNLEWQGNINNFSAITTKLRSWQTVNTIPRSGFSILCVNKKFKRGSDKIRKVFLSIICRAEVIVKLTYGLRTSEDMLCATFAVLRRGLQIVIDNSHFTNYCNVVVSHKGLAYNITQGVSATWQAAKVFRLPGGRNTRVVKSGCIVHPDR
ncbi:ribonuclease H [Senna tora]|uniref:Ribonuclease H n=1 Tax=Senna tora TaxID=362788 RepID=A0A834SS50_9FABA|nr:ribonuclease H [Senna tora]